MGDAKLHSYFYDVSSKYVTADRDFYQSDGGYGGLQVSGSIMKNLGTDISVGLYGRWTYIDGASYEDSPLVKTNNNYVIGTLLVWKIGESEKLEQ